MAKGLPWVGAYTRAGKPGDQYTPASTNPGKSPASLDGAATHDNGPIHQSLRGEQKPDASPNGRRTYG